MRARLRVAAVGSFMAVVGFAPIPLGYLLSAPGRGSETLFVADVLGVGLLLVAVALVAQALGFLAFLRHSPISRVVAVGAVADALAVAAIGVILLADRGPCTEGLYCSGQVVGSLARTAIYFWFPVLGIGYVFVGALVLAEPAVRRATPFAAAAGLLLGAGVALVAFLASIYNRGFGLVANLLFLLSLALSLAANAALGGAFLGSARDAANARRF